jgi:hypothetical protein
VITFFTIPKAFEGRSARIQRNAIGSWLELGDDVKVVLFGNDPGVAEASRELGVKHVPELSRTKRGTPRLDGAFAAAERIAQTPLLCYVNADIVLLDDFAAAARRLRSAGVPILGVGESWDVAIEDPIDFAGAWQDRVRELARTGRRRGAGALDYFLFTRRLYENLPPFAVGRVGFDNWLVWRAGTTGARVVDLTPSVRAVHQRHDYAHVAGGRDATRLTSEEGRRNIDLAGGEAHLHTRYDATHILGRRSLRRNLLRPFRLKENARKAVYKLRTHTPWPPADQVSPPQ